MYILFHNLKEKEMKSQRDVGEKLHPRLTQLISTKDVRFRVCITIGAVFLSFCFLNCVTFPSGLVGIHSFFNFMLSKTKMRATIYHLGICKFVL